jgi:transcriptional regulator with PAS, ATPase and Fis domain
MKTLKQVELEHMLDVLARTSTLAEASKVLGINDATIYRKRAKHPELSDANIERRRKEIGV